jgi:hypothetical protein
MRLCLEELDLRLPLGREPDFHQKLWKYVFPDQIESLMLVSYYYLMIESSWDKLDVIAVPQPIMANFHELLVLALLFPSASSVNLPKTR